LRTPSSNLEGLKPAVKRAWAGKATSRFDTYWEEILALFEPGMDPGCRILDVGAGRTPFLSPDKRPAGCTYVGLDVSRSELESSAPGSYDEFVVGSVCQAIEQLEGQFDVVISWQLLEHVKPLDDALANIRSYLRPGGQFLGQLSGAFSYFALAGRVLPTRAVGAIVRVAQRRDPITVFPAYYHHCWAGAIERIMSDWTSAEVIPRWFGDAYLTRSRMLLAANAAYEHWAMKGGRANLATHYLINAYR